MDLKGQVGVGWTGAERKHHTEVEEDNMAVGYWDCEEVGQVKGEVHVAVGTCRKFSGA